MEVESVYEDGEEEGLFVRREGMVVMMCSCIHVVLSNWLARTASGWAAIWWHWRGGSWCNCLQAKEESVDNNVVDVLCPIRMP